MFELVNVIDEIDSNAKVIHVFSEQEWCEIKDRIAKKMMTTNLEFNYRNNGYRTIYEN